MPTRDNRLHHVQTAMTTPFPGRSAPDAGFEMPLEVPASAPPDAETAALAHALITGRFSVSPKRLVAPGPSAAQLQHMVEAAGCAPDHELLRPWRLIHIAASQREALADVFVRALLERLPTASSDAQAQSREKAFRAPELLLAVALLEPSHGSVPESERYVAMGAALMNLLLAAHGMGFAAMLTSGHALRTTCFAQAFGLRGGERAVCFVSIGTATEVRRRSRPSAHELITPWQPSGDTMALPHAQPLDVIDVRPLDAGLQDAVTTSLLKTPALQLMRLIFRAGNGMPQHSVQGAITIHCLEGEATVTTPSRSCNLRAGQLVMLSGGEPHAVNAVTDASLLVTVLLHTQSSESRP